MPLQALSQRELVPGENIKRFRYLFFIEGADPIVLLIEEGVIVHLAESKGTNPPGDTGEAKRLIVDYVVFYNPVLESQHLS